MNQTLLNDRYRLDERIAESNRATVFKAWDTRLRRPVAIKMLRRSESLSEEERKRFLEAARALARFSHPNVVTVHDGAVADEMLYVVTEWLPGDSLEARLAAGPLPPTRAVAITRALADALERARGERFPSLNLTPSNIRFGADDKPKLVSFGWRDVALPPPGEAGSTVPLRTEEASRELVFDLGALLYRMVTGREPEFDGKHGPIVPEAINPGVPPRLGDILGRALAPDPQARFASATAFSDALAPFAPDDLSRVHRSNERTRVTTRLSRPSVAVPEEERPPKRTRGVRAALVALLLLLCSAVLVVELGTQAAQRLRGQAAEQGSAPLFGSTTPTMSSERAAEGEPSPSPDLAPTATGAPDATDTPLPPSPTPEGRKPPPPPPGENDRLYPVELPGQSDFVVTMNDLTAGIDFDLYLYDAASNELGSSINSGSEAEQIALELPAGAYVIRVHYYEGPPSASYNIRWNWEPSQ